MTALLLDEMLSPAIAVRLNESTDLDVAAVSTRSDLRGSADSTILEAAAAEGRIVVTYNIRDFALLSQSWAAVGRLHSGLLFVSHKSHPADRNHIGRLVAALTERAKRDDWPVSGAIAFA